MAGHLCPSPQCMASHTPNDAGVPIYPLPFYSGPLWPQIVPYLEPPMWSVTPARRGVPRKSLRRLAAFQRRVSP